MTYKELLKYAGWYKGAVLLDKIAPYNMRRSLRRLLSIGAVAFFVAGFVTFGPLEDFAFKAKGLFLIMFSFWVLTALLDTFYYSKVCRGLSYVIQEPFLSADPYPVSYHLASLIILTKDNDDMLAKLSSSHLGSLAFLRLGISEVEVDEYFKTHRNKYSKNNSTFKSDSQVRLSDILREMISEDESFRQFLLSHEAEPADFIRALVWVERSADENIRKARFWSRDNLASIDGIGKDWSYGKAYSFERWSSDVLISPQYKGFVNSMSHEKDARELELVLSKSKEANALVLSEDPDDALDTVVNFARKIKSGDILNTLKGRRVFIFDASAFVAEYATKEKFEKELIKVMDQALRAGNIIVVIENIASFATSSASMGADVFAVLDRYLSSSSLQMICISTPTRFHEVLERNTLVQNRFEKLQVTHVESSALLSVIENDVLRLEKQEGVIFTIQAIKTATSSASRYFNGASPRDKAMDILMEASSEAKRQERALVSADMILSLVETKTGIKTGKVTVDEKNLLLHLEDLLHHRIIGQDEAVKAIASAMRRARSGIENKEKPMGSFLFLGPTGVGKTETTKALASTFFKSEQEIIRFDMSEYAGSDALPKLIGSFDSGKPGLLSSALEEHPYGVLLLDEFEKTTREVHNIFLQILDEGFFSDMSGKRINARNVIVIATSNAGSDLIWKMFQEGKDVIKERENILNNIIASGVFKPELLNRFDGIILFHPLAREHLAKIARLQLEKLAKRLREKGIEFVITDDVVDFLVEKGSDPKFGARPVNRAISDVVEERISRKIIEGTVKAGSSISLSKADLNA